MSITIAIDGHSACGKSTLAKALARALDYLYLDSGAMYRAVTYYFLENDIDTTDEAAIDHALSQIELEFPKSNTTDGIVLNKQLLTHGIRSSDIDRNVSAIAAIESVRTQLVLQQRQIGAHGGIVMDGRDIGSVVFPNAALKLFVTASIAVRTARRYEQVKSNLNLSPITVQQDLLIRDRKDTTRAISPLVQTADAILLDNSNLSRAEQLAMTIALANCRCA